MPKSVELRGSWATTLALAREIVDRADAEKRELTAEESGSWDTHMAEMRSIEESIKRHEYLESIPAPDDEHRSWLLTQDQRGAPPASQEEAETRQKRAYAEAFRDYILFGKSAMKRENLQVLEMRGVPFSTEERAVVDRFFQAHPEYRAQEIGSAILGGFWVPDEMFQRIEKAELYFGGMRSAGAEILTTDSGADLPWPVYDDTGNTGRRIAENAAFTETNINVGVRIMKAYMYSSDEVLVSLQFLQDAAVRAEGWLADALGERIGRITNTEFTNYAAPDGPRASCRRSRWGSLPPQRGRSPPTSINS